MAELTTIARPYAKAAFQFARENDQLEQWADALALMAAVAEDKTVAAYLQQPQLTAEQQAETFSDLCGEKLSDSQRNFVSQLAQNKRLPVLPEICSLYMQYLAELQKTVDVNVATAYPLASDEEQKLIDRLKAKLGVDVHLSQTVDESLIGGVVIRAGDLVIDSSVRGKIAKLAETLNS